MEYDYILTESGELYHYGIKGQKWGVRRSENKIAKYRKKAAQYDKESKMYAKEGSRRIGSDGARQTDSEMAWMKQLSADSAKKSQKYAAKAKAIEDKQAFRKDVNYVKSNMAGSTVDFYNKRSSQKGKAYVDKVYNRAVMETAVREVAHLAGIGMMALGAYNMIVKK